MKSSRKSGTRGLIVCVGGECDGFRTRDPVILERRHWVAILFLMGPSNASKVTENLRNGDGGICDLAPSMLPL